MVRGALRLVLAAGVVAATLAVARSAGTPTPDEIDTSAAPTTSAAGEATTVPTSAPTTIPTTTPPTTKLPTTEGPQSDSVTLTFTGDVLIHSRVWNMAASHATDAERAFDFEPLFEPIRPWVEEADWAVCHLEVNLSADNSRLASYPQFRAPREVADALVGLGYDSCSTASNHSLDHGQAGVAETLGVLDEVGLAFSGTARHPVEAATSHWIEVDGIRIAHLAYSYWFNGFELPPDAPWLANQIDEDRILEDASKARQDGADVVILSMHWGDQYVHRPNQQQADLGPRLLASPDVDLIIGHHAHVVQPIERIDDEWLVYGLGNLMANQTRAPRRDELLVTVELVPSGDGIEIGQLSVVPLYVDPATLTVMPSGPTSRPADLEPGLEAQLDASWDRAIAVLESGSGWSELELVGRG